MRETKKRETPRPAGKQRLARYGMEQFLLQVSTNFIPGSLLLDAGAGDCKHLRLFSHVRTVALDNKPTRYRRYGEIDLSADLYALPLKGDVFAAVVNVEVLEHLAEPEKALKEMLRVLHPGGRLYLIVPQGWEEHNAPHDYFRYTKYGLRYLFEKAGYRVVSITPLGGYFWYIGHRIPVAYRYLFPAKRKLVWRILEAPLRHAARFFLRTLVPYVCFYLDRLDTQKTYTLNYGCICEKPTPISPSLISGAPTAFQT
jgi:SAM-dependent methyltransferase